LTPEVTKRATIDICEPMIGRYRFELKASANEGAQNEKRVSRL
jgi:hypothetical protein